LEIVGEADATLPATNAGRTPEFHQGCAQKEIFSAQFPSRQQCAGTLRGRFHDVPNRLGRDSITPDLPQPTYPPEDRTIIDASRRGPLIDGKFRPYWNRNGTDVFSFANQVSDYPVLLADLEIFCSESNQFGPSQAASNEQRQNRPITFASEAV
jgi:hypothetical protein